MSIDKDTSLTNAIEKAQTQLEGKTEEPAVEETVETTEEATEEATTETSEEKAVEETKKSDDLSDEEKVEALNLYRALGNPQSRDAVIAALAQKAGLLGTQTTKSEVKEDKLEIQSIFKEALGPELAFLADKLGPAIDKVLSAAKQEAQKETLEKFEAIERQRKEEEVTRIWDKLNKETKGEFKKLEKEMSELAEKFKPGEGVSTEEYMRGLYAQASARFRSKQVKAQINDKINRNAKDIPSRVQPIGTVELPTGKMDLNKAVDWAAQQLINKG